MPLLRSKRANMTGDAELRRSKVLPDDLQISVGDPPLKTAKSNIDLPTLRLSPSSPFNLDADLGAVADAAANNSSSNNNRSTPTISVPAPPVTPPHDSPSSSLIPDTNNLRPHDPLDRPDSPPIQDETPKHRRFSMLRFRNASDSQLSARAKKQTHAHSQAQAHADDCVPPLPRAPDIGTTAAPTDAITMPRKQSRLFSRIRRSGEELRADDATTPLAMMKKDRRKSFIPATIAEGKKSISIEASERRRPKSSNAPRTHTEETVPPLPLTGSRMSESSRSEGSSATRMQGYGNTPLHPLNSHASTSNFFRLPRRKPKDPLFPLAHLQRRSSHDQSVSSQAPFTPTTPARESTSSTVSGLSPQRTPGARTSVAGDDTRTTPVSSPGKALFQKSNASPATALFRPKSRNSGTSSPTRSHVNLRGRSSTMSSLGRESLDDRLGPPQSRASTSTGRKSFGDLLGISRLRNGPDSHRQGTGTPGSSTSKENSLNIQREFVLPEKREDESPGKYLERLEEIASRSVIASALSKHGDDFHLAVLRSFMRRFGFFGDPMDMAIRKLLMSAELPKETQHIDRFLQAFANRYHECNPGIYANPDQAYFIAFSLLILHTDVFNKNNKHKMQKSDYVKNTKGEGIANEVLEVMYDNITYTPFIHVEDDLDMTADRPQNQKASKKKPLLPNPMATDVVIKKAAKEPIDPYTIILDNRLDILRPNLKDVMQLEDFYNFVGTAPSLNMKELQKTFFRTGILQIVSARSRPDAFMSEKTATNPEEAQPGVVDIKVTKVGLLWRKDAKKKKTRRPWQEWGAILTGAQLYFFRDTAWVKSLMHQYEQHVRQGQDGVPIIFKPPLEIFKPDALMSTDNAVALFDASYKKHKNAFVYVRHGGLEEVLLADNEEELNDWLAKLNYAAAFRTNGVRMRGAMGGSYDGQGRRALRRLDSDAVQTAAGEVTITRSRIDQQMAQDIMLARREMILNKVTEANEKLQVEEKQLDNQLRNSRHLQLLAPIQPKTRDLMLLSAGRMAAQVKWTRLDIWKLRCHRDILLLDLEDERQMLGLPAGPGSEAAGQPKLALGREASKLSKDSSGTITVSPSGLVADSPSRIPVDETPPTVSDDDSVATEVFRTPPTSVTAPPVLDQQNPWDSSNLGFVQSRKASISSAKSAKVSDPGTPPRTAATSSSAPETGVIDDDHPEEDADEREILEQAGLLGGKAAKSPEPINKSRPFDSDYIPEHAQHSTSLEKDKSDKNKIRRSLQRTLREGAGHLSHARSHRKGKDSTGSAPVDEIEAETLTRAAGPFVVHGKKASVITFGSELQILSPDERLRARKTSQREGPANGDAAEEAAASNSGNGSNGDFRVFLLSGSKSAGDRRRSSAASASTATARSFRELHRKYSTAARGPAGLTLAIPTDDDSDAALSFSDGRRSPLPPEQVEEVDEEEESQVLQTTDEENSKVEQAGDEGQLAADGKDDNEVGVEMDADEFRSATMDKARETLFFTPEPPESPVAAQSDAERVINAETPVEGRRKDRLPSPTISVSAA